MSRRIIKKVTKKVFLNYLAKVGYGETGTNWSMLHRKNGLGTHIHVTDVKISVESKALFNEDYCGGIEFYFDSVWLEYMSEPENGIKDMVSLLAIPGSGKTKDCKVFISFYRKE